MTGEPGRPLVVVVGGGISGLAAARVLAGCVAVSDGAQASARRATPHGRSAAVVVLEALDQPGGKLTSLEIAGRAVEAGADQFLRRDPSAERLCRHLGLGDDLVAPARGSAAIWSRGALRGFPRGLVLGVPTDLDALAASGIVSPEALERARQHDRPAQARPLTEAELGLDDKGSSRVPNRAAGAAVAVERSAGEILRAALGDEIVDRLVDPLLGGINAGSVDALSLGLTAPQLARAIVGRDDLLGGIRELVQPNGARSDPPPSPFFGLRGGLARMVRAVSEEIRSAGGDIRAGSPVRRIRHSATAPPAARSWNLEVANGDVLEADGIVLAAPGFALADLTRDFAPAAADELNAVAYSSVAVVTYEFGAGDAASDWTGFLVPRVEGKLATAVTFLSAKWPWMARAGTRLVRVSAGRHGDSRAAQFDDGELARRLLGELQEMTGSSDSPSAVVVARFDRSFPQYEPGHSARMARANEALRHFGSVELAGAVLGGIGVPACITSGEAAAARIQTGLGL